MTYSVFSGTLNPILNTYIDNVADLLRIWVVHRITATWRNAKASARQHPVNAAGVQQRGSSESSGSRSSNRAQPCNHPGARRWRGQ